MNMYYDIVHIYIYICIMNIFFCYFIIVYKILYFLFSRYRFTFIDRLYFLLFKHFLFLYKILYTFLNLLLSFKEKKKQS